MTGPIVVVVLTTLLKVRIWNPSKAFGVHIYGARVAGIELCAGVRRILLVDGCDRIGSWFELDGPIGGMDEPCKG